MNTSPLSPDETPESNLGTPDTADTPAATGDTSEVPPLDSQTAETSPIGTAADPAADGTDPETEISAADAELDDAAGDDTAAAEAPAAAAPLQARRRGRTLVWAAAITVPLLVTGGAVAATAHKTIELDYDGEISTVSTWSGSVEGFLETQEIELAEHDEVAPTLDAPLSEGSVVVIRIAQEVELEIGGETTTLWTTADSAHEVLNDLRDSGRDGSVLASSRSVADGRDPMNLPLVTDGEVVLSVDGEEHTQHFSEETSLKGVLDAFEITLGETDEVRLDPHDSGAIHVTVTRIVHEERTDVEPVAFETETRTTGELYTDQSRVVQAGVEGERTIVSEVILIDGEEDSVTEISNEITTAPVTKIVENGTKKRPAPAPSSGGGGAVGGDVWAKLAQCESGGNPSAVSASGTYHGLYQFSVATWQSVGGSGLPSQASAAEQTQRAQALQARSGWGQWPHCSSKLGLR